jgi:hypothetical protein
LLALEEGEFPESPSLAAQFSFSPKETNGMIGSAMNVDGEEFSFIKL